MKITPFILLLLILSKSTFAQTDSSNIAPNTFDCEVKTNGVYYANLDKEANIYIHFHENDTVVTTSSVKDVELASKFVNKKLGAGILFGKYFISDTNFERNKEVLRTELINYIRISEKPVYFKLFEWTYNLYADCIKINKEKTIKIFSDSFAFLLSLACCHYFEICYSF